MSITQLITLLILVGGLAIFTIQNLTPSLPLIFLGNQLPALPLSLWILIGITAGILTYWMIAQLFQFSNTNLKASTAFQGSSKPPVEPDRNASWGYTSPPPEPPQTSGYTAYNSVSHSEPEPTFSRSSEDDWETEVKPFNPSWEAEDRTEPRKSSNNPQNFNSNSSDEEDWNQGEGESLTDEPKVYETEQQPKSESWSGSVYSYGYRGDSNRTGVGKVETIYDADYRIITPPPQTKIQDDIEPPHYPAQDDDEDWGLEEEESDEPYRK
ncbi:hypothetical protein PCC9214_03302 [Planktothrix tepida]|uniref:Lipopolysaccharide assembly protein A domain-containing protein n=2 Tax=Planktothrix TaxID=54304 RepID=A0A1J1LTG5_9CYAN|nr:MULTISPECIES: hypothetical protein [Planktothrix]CAD5947733.1 hypothetical protein NO713_02350 [Planktothrix pseudagardhii]CAD5962848.1 hypothetical protein PCC9214_03302 [Planktothrix tepida]CUR34849.1 conserved hypothetical protein [Planktothrix tepida PCC 9214]